MIHLDALNVPQDCPTFLERTVQKKFQDAITSYSYSCEVLSLVETCEQNTLFFEAWVVAFSGWKAISKVYTAHIVNTHFRYQLRNVEFKVGIFLYWHKL